MSNKTKKHNAPMSPIKKKEKEKSKTIEHTIRAVRMASLLALRNQGYGRKRLIQFNDEFNNILTGVSNGYMSLSDIVGVLEREVNITLEDLEWGK